jgi:hypothetical protein
LKVPADFSGSATKFDDGGDAEGDDDIGDEEEDLPAAKPSNRQRGRGRLTLTNSVVCVLFSLLSSFKGLDF